MAKFVDKIKDFIAGPYDDEYEDDYEEYEDEDEYEEYRPRAREKKEVSMRETKSAVDYTSSSRSSRKSQAQPQVVDFKSASNQQVVIMKPSCYDDAHFICDNIRAKRPVVVNLEKVEYPVAQKIMDFLIGACYALDGSLQRVSSNIFIIAPVNFDIESDAREETKSSKSVILPWVNQGR